MKSRSFFKMYALLNFLFFVCLLSIPIFAQTNSQTSAEETEAPREVLMICEDEAEATEVPGNYVVEEGETLESIAESLAVSVEDLVAVNELALDAELAVGQVLIIPDNSADCIDSSELIVWYINTRNGVNALVRACPEPGCEIVTRLPFASEIRVFATENGWHSILLDDGTVAYVAVIVSSPYLPQAPIISTANPTATVGSDTANPSNSSSGSAGSSDRGGGVPTATATYAEFPTPETTKAS